MERTVRSAGARLIPVIVLAVLGLASAAPLAAQRLAPALPAAWDAASIAAIAPQAVQVVGRRRDYRWVGTAVGALGLGIAAGLEAAAACGNSEDGPRSCTGVVIGVGLLGAAVGGTIGHFVGRAIKHGDPDEAVR